LARLDPFDLLLIEQPLPEDDIRGHAELAKMIRTPVCLDESIESARDAADAIAMGACAIVNIKPGRVGGYLEARRVHDVCVANGIAVWCGGMLETGIGRAHNISLSTLPGFSLPGDVSASKRYWAEDIIEPEVEVSIKGEITVPTTAGRGFEVKTGLVEKLTVRKEEVRALQTV
jgi:o-succinylbenzoate synthase